MAGGEGGGGRGEGEDGDGGRVPRWRRLPEEEEFTGVGGGHRSRRRSPE